MENVKLNKPFQNLIVDYQLKIIDEIDFWATEIENPTKYNIGLIDGLEKAKILFIETIKEMETKYNETL